MFFSEALTRHLNAELLDKTCNSHLQEINKKRASNHAEEASVTASKKLKTEKDNLTNDKSCDDKRSDIDGKGIYMLRIENIFSNIVAKIFCFFKRHRQRSYL